MRADANIETGLVLLGTIVGDLEFECVNHGCSEGTVTYFITPGLYDDDELGSLASSPSDWVEAATSLAVEPLPAGAYTLCTSEALPGSATYVLCHDFDIADGEVVAATVSLNWNAAYLEDEDGDSVSSPSDERRIELSAYSSVVSDLDGGLAD